MENEGTNRRPADCCFETYVALRHDYYLSPQASVFLNELGKLCHGSYTFILDNLSDKIADLKIQNDHFSSADREYNNVVSIIG